MRVGYSQEQESDRELDMGTGIRDSLQGHSDDDERDRERERERDFQSQSHYLSRQNHTQSTSIGSSMAVGGSSVEQASSNRSTASSVPPLINTEALIEEKKNLHAYLKAYEHDFHRQHGRAVMRHEDIQPVAQEYQRYKELKQQLKTLGV